jgi:hypothetical protein
MIASRSTKSKRARIPPDVESSLSLERAEVIDGGGLTHKSKVRLNFRVEGVTPV